MDDSPMQLHNGCPLWHYDLNHMSHAMNRVSSNCERYAFSSLHFLLESIGNVDHETMPANAAYFRIEGKTSINEVTYPPGKRIFKAVVPFR
jgi:hypothetical protein